MHFNVYVDDQTGQKLDALAQQQHVSRNLLIRKAIDSLLQHQKTAWPIAVMNFQGVKDFPGFEDRSDLEPPPEDPFA